MRGVSSVGNVVEVIIGVYMFFLFFYIIFFCNVCFLRDLVLVVEKEFKFYFGFIYNLVVII